MENLQISVSNEVFIIEPFYGGSHKLLVDGLTRHLSENGIGHSLITLPAKKWHWRARCGALQIYDKIPKVTREKVLWCSSVLNLAELLGLRSDLQELKKIVYFHENQLIYPVQEIKSRDVQYGYNQITTW
ncbi:hypothetical protein JTB14_010514 [Gonioctena quinquepunctata]|nr:hypothetical protein JTB14_010514 [Gonioctena quinquepunctata]